MTKNFVDFFSNVGCARVTWHSMARSTTSHRPCLRRRSTTKRLRKMWKLATMSGPHLNRKTKPRSVKIQLLSDSSFPQALTTWGTEGGCTCPYFYKWLGTGAP